MLINVKIPTIVGILKGTATLMISMLYQKELYELWYKHHQNMLKNKKVMGI